LRALRFFIAKSTNRSACLFFFNFERKICAFEFELRVEALINQSEIRDCWAVIMAFIDLCRLCGIDTVNLKRIFEGEGRLKKYALKITECLTLKVIISFLHRPPRSKFPQPLMGINNSKETAT
jgi:hypothetical protein